MDVPSKITSVAPTRCWFCWLAMLLMFVGVAAAFVQKGRESNVAVTVAKRIASGIQETEEHRNEVHQIIQAGERWQMLSFAAVILAMASWGTAAWRREKCRGSWAIIVSFLALYIGLELLMV